MCLPAILLFFVFCYIPMPGAYIAFVNYNYTLGIFRSPFTGIENFRFLFISGDLARITWNTIWYNLIFILVGTVMQIAVAVMLNEIASRWFKNISQTVMFLPYFISFVLVGLLLFNFIDFDAGIINSLRVSFGIKKIDYYNNSVYWPFILTFINTWKGTGYGSIIYLAAIMGLDTEIVEASQIDGASCWQKIRYIILPSLKPTVVILTLFAIGGIMKGNFQLFYNTVGANNVALYHSTDIIDTYVFRSLMTNFNFSLGSAAGLYQSVLGFILILLANWGVRKVEPEYALF